MGMLPVNWFGIIFLLTAFVLFILDIKAPTHGALTTAGVASFIVGALVLFNSARHASIPACIRSTGDRHRASSSACCSWSSSCLRCARTACADQHGGRILRWENGNSPNGRRQEAEDRSSWDLSCGAQNSVESSEPIGKGDRVEVVEVKGLRLKVRKVK